MKTTALCVLLAMTGSCPAQSVRSLVNGGNDLYKDGKFPDAEVNYRKALEKEQELVQGHFNLGTALYKQGKLDESLREFETASKAAEKNTGASAYYNMGNAFLRGQHYQEAVRSYIESLKINPSDRDEKYNLSYALAKMKEQQQQKDKSKGDKNKDQKDKQDQEDQKDKQDQKQDQDQKDKQDQQQQQQQSQQQGQPQEKRMSSADAQRILDVLKNNEKDVQKKLRVRQGVRAKTERDW